MNTNRKQVGSNNSSPSPLERAGVRLSFSLVYFKQAWQLLKQNKLYSTVYIIGTGLAIAMTMVIAIVYYIKIAPMYPEVNRNRTLVAKGARITYPEQDGMNASSFSYPFVRDHLYTMQTPEVVSAVLTVWDDYPLVELANGRGMLPVTVKYTDANYWKVFGFAFISGQSFTNEEFESGIQTVVISASLANTLFGTTTAEGKRVTLDGNDYRVCGVVKEVSLAASETYAQVWVPFTMKPENLKSGSWGEGLLGQMRVYFLARSASGMKQVKEEADEIVRNINSSQEKYVFSMVGQPEPYWKSVFRQYSNQETDWAEIIKTFGTLILALLFIPAVNLAGMVSSRMEKRLSEIGIRKVFGASRGTLLGQMLAENLILTLIGGLLGLILSYGLIYTSKNWVLTLFDKWPDTVPEGVDTLIGMSMLFNPVVFFVALAVCFVLNLLSAIVPAYYGLKKGIVYSISNSK